MTTMTPIPVSTPAASAPQTAFLAAEKLSGFRAVAVEMLADAARALDTAAGAPASIAAGLRAQARLRMTGVRLLLNEIAHLLSHENITQIVTDLDDLIATPDIAADRVRSAAEMIDALMDLELYQLRLGGLWDRYVT